MENLFTLLIIIGAIASLISKANKNAPKGVPGKPAQPGQMNRPPMGGQMQNRQQMNGGPVRPPMSTPQMNGQMPRPQHAGSLNPMNLSGTQKEAQMAPKLAEMTALVDALKPLVKTTVVPLTSGGEVIPEDQNYGEGFADEEGTSFGDGSKGVEGECVDEHTHADLSEKPYEVTSSEESSWDFSEKSLLNAVIYSEILGKPKSLKHNHR